MKKYAVVTTIQTFRHRYAIPMDKLQEKNPNGKVSLMWALDSVTMDEVKEFSQQHLGEQISDACVLNEPDILKLFDDDNSYLKAWSVDKKLEWINDCWENPSEALIENDIYSHGMSTPGDIEHEI